jgi:hypothetical protein
MKIFFGRFLVACFLLVAASFVFAGEFKSRIITSSPLTITVQDDHFLRISNFTQQGGVDRGVVTVTLNSQTDQTDQTGQTGQTANVLTASRVDTVSSGGVSPTPLETINRVVIAGPAQVTVAPVLGATLFITYRKLPEEGKGTTTVVIAPTPTATPTPTPTVTPTPTATPTPTPTP